MTKIRSVFLGSNFINVGWNPIRPGSFGGKVRSYTIEYTDSNGNVMVMPDIPVSVICVFTASSPLPIFIFN